MFANLLAEAARYAISKKQICEAAGIGYKALGNKLNGYTEFTWGEIRKIRALFPVHFNPDYLFAINDDTTEKVSA